MQEDRYAHDRGPRLPPPSSPAPAYSRARVSQGASRSTLNQPPSLLPLQLHLPPSAASPHRPFDPCQPPYLPSPSLHVPFGRFLSLFVAFCPLFPPPQIPQPPANPPLTAPAPSTTTFPPPFAPSSPCYRPRTLAPTSSATSASASAAKLTSPAVKNAPKLNRVVPPFSNVPIAW